MVLIAKFSSFGISWRAHDGPQPLAIESSGWLGIAHLASGYIWYL